MSKPITAIRVLRMYETCKRTTFFVELTNSAGQTITPESFATGSLYTDMKGLSVDEARDRALISADEWAGFCGLTAKPYCEDGRTYEPSMRFGTYDEDQ